MFRIDETILDRLRSHAKHQPERLVYRFLRDDGGSDTLTFGQLDRRVRGLAPRLREFAAPGDRALLLYPPGLEFIEAFLACLAAGVIAVPAYPPRRNRKADRLRAITDDARPRLILTTRQVLPTLEASELADIQDAVRLATDDVETDDNGPSLSVSADAVAFLQYTSGSTGSPRGVVVSHANLMANEAAIQAAFRHTPDDVVVGWLPAFHDMGLIGNVLQPLYVGFPAILLSPTSFLTQPVRWLRAITEYRATTSGAPDFAYDHCVRAVTEEQKRGLDLRSWTIAYNGAEPVRAETLDRFVAAFAPCGFRPEAFFPCYGLAEATLFVSGGPPGKLSRHRVEPAALEAGQVVAVNPPHGRCLVASGRPGEWTKVVVVDPATREPVPDGEVGHLWVLSPSVAAGYWNRPDETARVFGNRLASGEGPFLDTGDLGFLDGGEVYVTGRSKDLIIIAGRNIYPQDVEAAVERVLPFLKANSCAAFSVEAEGKDQLAVVVEADRTLVRSAQPTGELPAAVVRVRQSVLRECEVRVSRVAFVRPGTFPRTSSGKVQRRACRDGLRDGTLEVIHSWQETCAGAAV
jgi:acyl-CoA synthetase (AMP-forming)/AMP-acid ligase II